MIPLKTNNNNNNNKKTIFIHPKGFTQDELSHLLTNISRKHNDEIIILPPDNEVFINEHESSILIEIVKKEKVFKPFQ